MRRDLLVLGLLVAVLSAGLTPLAGAQIPALPTACGPLEATLVQPSAALAPGQQGTITVTVGNGGAAGANVVVGATTAAAGWTISPPEQSTAIAGGQSATYQFTVTPQAGAASEAAFNFNAQGTCTAGGQACPPGVEACVTGTDAFTASARLAEPQGLRIPGLEGLDFPLEYLVGGLLLLALAALLPLLAKRRRGGFLATCPEPLKLMRPGMGISFPIEVMNRGRKAITVAFEVGSVPDGWSAFMAMPELQLAAGERRSLWLMVRSPPLATAGQRSDITIRVRAADGSVISVRVRAEVDPGATDGSPSGDAAPS